MKDHLGCIEEILQTGGNSTNALKSFDMIKGLFDDISPYNSEKCVVMQCDGDTSLYINTNDDLWVIVHVSINNFTNPFVIRIEETTENKIYDEILKKNEEWIVHLWELSIPEPV